ncbi:unnamed protein product [Toxocara canis]|uniref:Secreted protein n=1 Tax=Toxocara canis TaxID=6265 RepID=A0A183TV81_TOXCA|nr:unnamed protein product [Toxocara canis]
MRSLSICLLSLTLSYGQLIVLPTNLEFIKQSDLKLIFNSIKRLQDDYFTLQKQIFATGRDGFERLLTNLKQNIERVTAISMDQRGGLLNKMLGTEKSSTSSEVFRSSSGKDSSRQWAPPIVIKNNVPTRHTFHSERSNSTT